MKKRIAKGCNFRRYFRDSLLQSYKELLFFICGGCSQGALRALIQKYPSLADKWPQTESSLVLKGDVVEYVLWCSSIDVAPDYVTEARKFNELLYEWDCCWKELLVILAGHWDEELTNSKLPTCRNMGQLIGLSAGASRLPANRLDRAFNHYTRG